MSTEALLSKMVSVKIHTKAHVYDRIPRSTCVLGSRGTKQLEIVATSVMAATGSFYSARGIGSQASVGAAVDKERWAGKTHLIIFFGIEMVLCDLYLKSFDLTKGLLFDTFVITLSYKLCRCDHSVLEFK